MRTITFLIIFALSSTLAQMVQAQHNKTIVISPKSELNIVGSSNVNDFQCLFGFNNKRQSLPVSFQEANNGIIFNKATLSLKNTSFDCGGRAINRDFHSLLKSEQHPEIILRLKKLNKKSQSKNLVEALVEIHIAGKSKAYVLNAKVNQKDELHILGNLKLNIKDFGLETPKKMMGLIVVSEQIEINFNLIVEQKTSHITKFLN